MNLTSYKSMERQKKPILSLVFPQFGACRSVSDYRASLHVTKQSKKFPEWDNPRCSVDMLNVQMQRDIYYTDKRVVRARERASVEYKKFDKLWADLQMKEETLRASFIHFNVFTNENEEKRIRALKKIQGEKHLIEQRIEMIKETAIKNTKLAISKSEFEIILKEYRIYEDFLNKVISQYPTIFKNANEIITRYESLTQSKLAIQNKRVEIMDELDVIKSKLQKLTEEKLNKLIEMNSKMVDLVARHGHARGHALRWESVVGNIRQAVEIRYQDQDCIKLVARQVYHQLCNRRGIQISERTTHLEQQFRFIKTVLKDLNMINRTMKRSTIREGHLSKKRKTGSQLKFVPKNSIKKIQDLSTDIRLTKDSTQKRATMLVMDTNTEKHEETVNKFKSKASLTEPNAVQFSKINMT